MANLVGNRKKSESGIIFWPTAIFVFVFAIIIVFIPPLLSENRPAEIMLSLLLAIATTAFGYYSSKQSSETQAFETLTRYGLQAWRNLNSLLLKVNMAIENPDYHSDLLGWSLDIDEARLAWQDLLKDVFELQERLQYETEEVSTKYQARLAEAKTPEDRSKIEAEQRREFAKLLSQAPLPIRLPEKIRCPACKNDVSTTLGSATGSTSHANCDHCSSRFPIHRLSTGEIKIGAELLSTSSVIVDCPNCDSDIHLRVSESHKVRFEHQCAKCKSHLEFNGDASDYQVLDLGIFNSTYDCPSCEKNNQFWISPRKQVEFITRCIECNTRFQINGEAGKFEIHNLP